MERIIVGAFIWGVIGLVIALYYKRRGAANSLLQSSSLNEPAHRPGGLPPDEEIVENGTLLGREYFIARSGVVTVRSLSGGWMNFNSLAEARAYVE